MNRFLDNLAVRLLNPAEGVQPRTPSRFEPEAAASPSSFFAPETVWGDAEGPNPGSPRRALPQGAPAQPPALSEDAAAAPLPMPPPAARWASADDPQAADRAVRPLVSFEAHTAEPTSRLPGVGRDEAEAEALRPPAFHAPSVSPARSTLDAERRVEVTPRGRAVTPTDRPVSEAQAARGEQAPPPPMGGARQDVPISPAAIRAEGQTAESRAATGPARAAGHTPLAPALSPDPLPLPVSVASAEAAVFPGGVFAVETVTFTEGREAAPPPETPGRRPAAVTVRAVPAPLVSAAGPSSPAAREAPAPQAPTIHVTIGRIEVRAGAPAPRAGGARPNPPKLTLEEFLRDGGRK